MLGLNRKRSTHRQHRHRPMTALQRRYFGKHRHRRNPQYRRRVNARRHHRNAPLALIGVNNPRGRHHAKPRRRPSTGYTHRHRRDPGLGSLVGRAKSLFSPSYLVNTVAGGIGFLAGIAVPNWLFGGQTWYTANPWVKVGVRALFGLVAMPFLASFIPGGFGQAVVVGAGIAVGVSALTELTGHPVMIGGAADVTLTPNTFFTPVAGLGRVFNQGGGLTMGAYAPRRNLRLAGDMGAYINRLRPWSLGGTESHALSGIEN